MATTVVIPLKFDEGVRTLAPGARAHFHVDPRSVGDISDSAFVDVMVWPTPTSYPHDLPAGGDGTVVRAENFKAQLVIGPPDFGGANSYRFHWDVVNESSVPAKIRMSLLVITP